MKWMCEKIDVVENKKYGEDICLCSVYYYFYQILLSHFLLW